MAGQGKKNKSQEEKFIERVYQLRLKDPAKHTPSKNKANADQNPDHIDGQSLVRGNLAPGNHSYVFEEGKLKKAYIQSYYAWNAWNYIGSKSDAVRNIYDQTKYEQYRFFHPGYRPNFFQLFPTPALGSYDSAEAEYKNEKDPVLRRYYRRKTAVLFLSTKKGKRVDFIGACLPYPWQAHHLLPSNVFYKNLDLSQVKIILRTDYDINDGRNIIFLPNKPLDTSIHALPYHSSGHTKYDKVVKSKMKTLKSVLDQIKNEEIEHKDAAKSVEEELHNLETEMFQYTHGLGRKPKQKLS
ncbi:AHH domain-containing protein [Archangium lansingense]|uniref:AHH domain-containing protein n=1 Tax=Archangium lansingense TaxID=2995310 RepID=UPI003B805A87